MDLSKYLTKDLLLSVPASKKRVSTSRDSHLFQKKQVSGWGWDRIRIARLYEQFTVSGCKLERASEDEGGLVFFVLVADLEGVRKHERRSKFMLSKAFKHKAGFPTPQHFGVDPWVWQRRIPFVKVGRTVRFDIRDLEKYIQSYRRPATST